MVTAWNCFCRHFICDGQNHVTHDGSLSCNFLRYKLFIFYSFVSYKNKYGFKNTLSRKSINKLDYACFISKWSKANSIILIQIINLFDIVSGNQRLSLALLRYFKINASSDVFYYPFYNFSSNNAFLLFFDAKISLSSIRVTLSKIGRKLINDARFRRGESKNKKRRINKLNNKCKIDCALTYNITYLCF